MNAGGREVPCRPQCAEIYRHLAWLDRHAKPRSCSRQQKLAGTGPIPIWNRLLAVQAVTHSSSEQAPVVQTMHPPRHTSSQRTVSSVSSLPVAGRTYGAEVQLSNSARILGRVWKCRPRKPEFASQKVKMNRHLSGLRSSIRNDGVTVSNPAMRRLCFRLISSDNPNSLGAVHPALVLLPQSARAWDDAPASLKSTPNCAAWGLSRLSLAPG